MRNYLIVFLLVALAGFVQPACRSRNGKDVSEKETKASSTVETTGIKQEPQQKEPQNMHPKVRMVTTLGEIVFELDREHAPITVDNFLQYAKDGFYNGTIFHRVIQGFMIQGGGYGPGMKEKSPKAPIKNEAANGLKNDLGTIAMARTHVIDSATSQFFINCKDNAFLDHKDDSALGFGYAVFGKVIQGLEVVNTIEKVPTGTRGAHQNVPIEDVVITSVKVEQE